MLVGLACQMLVLPVACWAIARGFALPGALAVGLMLLAASPGGASANLFSHLARGDVALNITLTAVNSVLSLFTLPFIVNFALRQFMGESTVLPLQLGKVVQVFLVVLVPVGIGMAVRARRRAIAEGLVRPVRVVSVVFLGLVIIGALIKERSNLPGYFAQVGLAAAAFNFTSMAIGYFVPRLAGVERRQAIAIGMEIGVHNATLAIAIASSPLLLNNAQMAVPAAIYSVIMFCTAAAFSFTSARRQSTSGDRSPAPSAAPDRPA